MGFMAYRYVIHLIISLICGFLPNIRMPIRYILAEIQIKPTAVENKMVVRFPTHKTMKLQTSIIEGHKSGDN